MADEKPFRVKRFALPTEDAKQIFNPENCFARGELRMGADGNPVLAGDCQVMQFGKREDGNNCMFLCQADFSKVKQTERPVLASVVFDYMGRVIDLYYGNSESTPEWRTNVRDGTRATFGIQPPPTQPQPSAVRGHADLSPAEKAQVDAIHDILRKNGSKMTPADRMKLLEEKSKIMNPMRPPVQPQKAKEWGCTRVLKGPLDFIGCQRANMWDHHSVSLVEGFPFVSCVQVTAEFDKKVYMSPEDEGKLKPYFEHIPLTGTSRYGSRGHEYYDMTTLDNVFGNPGHDSFVVLSSNGTMSTIETRDGYRPRPKPIPLRLSVSNPDTRKKFEVELRKGHESVLSEMRALEWLETTRLVFPDGPIDETFADAAFVWVNALSKQFKAPGVSLSPAAMAKIIERRSTPAARLAPAMRSDLFASLVQQPVEAPRQNPISCNCTPTTRDPMCLHQFCQFRHAAPERLSFMWPMRHIVSGPPALVRLLTDKIAESQDAERTKKQAAEVAEAKRKADAAEKKAEDDAKRDRKNELARQATARRKEAKASVVAASAAPVAASLVAAPVASSAAPVAASAAPVAASLVAAPVAASAASASAARKRSTTPTSRATKKKKGGSKSKSKRRVRK